MIYGLREIPGDWGSPPQKKQGPNRSAEAAEGRGKGVTSLVAGLVQPVQWPVSRDAGSRRLRKN